MKKTDLIEACGFSLNVIAKFSKGEQVNMSVLCRLCDYFKCQMNDIVEYVPGGGASAEGAE